MRGTDTDELYINRHTERRVVCGELISRLALRDLPENTVLIHTRATLAILYATKQVKDRLAIKVRADKLATDLEIVRQVLEESVKGLLRLKEVVESEHTDHYIHAITETTCTGLTDERRYRTIRRRTAQNGTENILFLGRRTR